MYSFYRVEFAFDDADFIGEDFDLSDSIDLLINSVNEFNQAGLDNGIEIFLYNIQIRIMNFVIRIPISYNSKTDLLNSFKLILMKNHTELIGLNIQDDSNDEIIKTKLFKSITKYHCCQLLIQEMKSGGLISANSIEDFINEVLSDIEEDEDINRFDEEELDTDELTGIFDFPGQQYPGTESSSLSSPEEHLFNHLIGLDEFKQEMLSITRFAELNCKLKLNSKNMRIFPYHYLFTIEPGMGLSSILTAFSQHLIKHGVIQNSDIMEYEGYLDFTDNSKNLLGIFYKGDDGQYHSDDNYGVVALNINQQLSNPQFKFGEFMDLLWDIRGSVIFVLIVDNFNPDNNQRIIKRIKSKVNCHHISFPPYTDNQLFTIAQKLIKKSGLTLDRTAKEILVKRITESKESGSFENLRTVQKIIEEIIVERFFNASNSNEATLDTISAQDLSVLGLNQDDSSDNAWHEFDNIIGLAEVKKRLKEIADSAKVQKIKTILGMKVSNDSNHMIFSGNPGTGKTTVARIMGRIFKEMGILKKGDLYEVSRDALVARYVGQTAPLVRDRVQEALGSVLFIDEAYSLYQGIGSDDKQDFGHEAVETLIKEMEDKRDQLVVIMAGYPDEMEMLLTMNPGLRERFPHKINFSDYNADELTKIFLQIIGEEYIFSSEVLGEIKILFEIAIENAEENFANGRLARNIAERLKIKQSMRLCTENNFALNELLTIKLQDIEALFEDEDIQKSVFNPQPDVRTIGFRPTSV